MVPCKGLSERLEDVLYALARQEYPGDYTVTFATETERDPGHTLVQRISNEFNHVRHILAGQATACSQKNHNLLAAMKGDHESEVFAFADADMIVGKTWLQELVAPLVGNKNWISTGLPSCDITKPHPCSGDSRQPHDFSSQGHDVSRRNLGRLDSHLARDL